MDRRNFLHLLASVSVTVPLSALAQNSKTDNFSKLVYPGKNGRIVYTPDESGNTIPDFSHAGYGGGGVKIPDIAVHETVKPINGDARALIQNAIDNVAKLPLDRNGFRGAVLLKKGSYRVEGTIAIRASGVVLRGEGDDEKSTVLIAARRGQHPLVYVYGEHFGEPAGLGQEIVDEYVPVGARSFHVKDARSWRAGDQVYVRRFGNQEWISAIGMDRIGENPDRGETQQWKPFGLIFDRIITAVDGNKITVDAPIACAIERRWGGGDIGPLNTSGRIRNVGIENIRGVSEFDKAVTQTHGGQKEKYFADENHAWDFISIGAAENCWVRRTTALHFGYAAVNIGKAKWVTVEDSKCLEMVSEITGSRRYCFKIGGQLNLVQRCEANTGRHDFVVDARVCGPNVFLYCTTGDKSYSTSEPHHRWSVGGLYDNVKAPLALQDRQYYGTGHGWSGANYVAWNTEGTLICQSPPTAQNWAIGHVGQKLKGAFEPKADGIWESHGEHVVPQSLYLAQLKDRLGAAAVKNIGYF